MRTDAAIRSGARGAVLRLLVAILAISAVALPALFRPALAEARTVEHSGRDGAVTVSADPAAVAVAPLPCDRHGEMQVVLTNTGTEPGFVDATFTAPSALHLSRTIISTYLPPDQPVRVPLTVTAVIGTDPGNYPVTLEVAGTSLQIPVTVDQAPGTDAGDNLALYRQAIASSTHPNVTLCGGVDGNTDSEQWGASGTHDRTSGEFPDTYGVQLDQAFPVGRVEVYTLDSVAHPAADMGIRDFDVQARVDGDWHTVRSVQGNELGHLSLTFTPVTADQVRLVVQDSNDHTFSRIVELEVFRS